MKLTGVKGSAFEWEKISVLRDVCEKQNIGVALSGERYTYVTD